MQDYHLDYHLGSWTFKVLFILNFSFSNSFFRHYFMIFFEFSTFGFFYWNTFFTLLSPFNSLAILKMLMILIQGYFWETNYYFLAQRGYNGNIFLNHFLDKKKMATHHFKSWLPYPLQRVNSVTKTNGIRHISLFIFVCVYNSLLLLPLSLSLSFSLSFYFF